MDLIILLAKCHVFIRTLRKSAPCIVVFKKILKHRYAVEKCKHQMNITMDKFRLSWGPYEVLIDSIT